MLAGDPQLKLMSWINYLLAKIILKIFQPTDPQDKRLSRTKTMCPHGDVLQ